MRVSLPQIFLNASQIHITANLANLPVNELPNSSRTTTSIWSTSTAISQSKFNNRYGESGDLSLPERPKAGNGRHLEKCKSPKENGIDLKRISVEIEPDQPLDMSFPSTFYKRCIYIALLPIMGPLFLTLPDVKKPVSIM